jgi:hypothetical protein
VLVVVLVVGRTAFAHQTSVKYVDLTLDGTHANISLRVAPGDVAEPMHLLADARPSAAEAAHAPGVAAFVAAWLSLTSFGQPCTADTPVAAPDADSKFVTVTWHASCARVPDRADFTRFFALDRRHVAMVRVTIDGDSDDALSAIVAADQPELALRERPSLFAWLKLGIHHIVAWDGRDHISFVLALLLVVMLQRDAKTRAWGVRPLVPSLRATATVITAFTIAHSLSLISAAMGWITLPSRLVESLIAVSIAYTAAEDIVRPDTRWRYWLTFGFGLVHGLGFASTLAVQLPPRAVVVPLLCFNVGVELGQLMIVVVALPAFYAAARALGAERYRRVLMPIFAGCICAAGVLWVIKRAFLV